MKRSPDNCVIGHWAFTGHWSLVIGHFTRVIGHSLVIGHWSLGISFGSLHHQSSSWHALRRVTSTEAIALLEKFRAGHISGKKVLHAFQAAPVADLGFAKVDLHRSLRKDFPEVIFGEGKSPEQVTAIALKIRQRDRRLLVTRITKAHARALRKKLPQAIYHETARCLTFDQKPLPKRPGSIVVLAAGT